jgi:hypothetical protein
MPTLDDLAVVSTYGGYLGAAIVAAAYSLNQMDRLKSQDWRFPATNLCGSLLVMCSLIWHLNTPSLVIEVFWSSISIYGIHRNLRAAKKQR